jgi:hypothetical protein
MTGTRRFMHEEQDRCVQQIGADATRFHSNRGFLHA